MASFVNLQMQPYVAQFRKTASGLAPILSVQRSGRKCSFALGREFPASGLHQCLRTCFSLQAICNGTGEVG